MSKNLSLGLLAMVIASLLLIPGLVEFSLWFDEVSFVEGSTALSSVGDLYELDQNARIVHPPLGFVIFRVWALIAGTDDFSLRALTVFFGLLTIAIVYKIGAIVESPEAGFGTGILLASMGFFQQYTHTTYNYSLFTLWSAVFVYFSIRYWLIAPDNLNLAGVVLSTSGLIYTHYYGFFLIVSLNLIAPLLGRSQALKKWFMGQFLAAMLYIPWIPALLELAQGVYRSTEKGGVAGNSINADVDGLIALFELLLYDGLAVYLLLSIAGIVLLALNNRRSSYHRRFLLILMTSVAGSLALSFLTHRLEPTLTARRLIFLIVGVAIAGGVVFHYLPHAGTVILAAVVIFLTPDRPMPVPVGADWKYRDGIEYIQQRAGAGDFVYIDCDTPQGLIGRPLNYYAENLLAIPFHLRGQPVSRLLHAAWVRDRLWLIWSPDRRTLEEILEPLESENKIYREVERQDFPEFSVSHLEVSYPTWIPSTSMKSDELQLPQDFGRMVHLVDYGVSQQTTKPGTTITLWLKWEPLHATTVDHALYIHLLDKNGSLAAQWDSLVHHLGRETYTSYWGPGNTILDAHKLHLPDDLPTGQYTLRIGLYIPQAARLIVNPGDGSGQRDGLIIAQITIHE